MQQQSWILSIQRSQFLSSYLVIFVHVLILERLLELDNMYLLIILYHSLLPSSISYCI